MASIQNKYPLWKYLLLIFLLILGIIYALPNLYGDDPAVQISGNEGVVASKQVITTVKTTLDNAHLPYKSIKQDESNLVLVRFYDTDTQLKAKDFIKAALSDKYTVALNLASATPKWLSGLGAEPMKLGLDLRGGVHFLLAVDVNSVIAKREHAEVRSIANELREQRIRYAGIQQQRQGTILVKFRSQDKLDKAYKVLSRQFPDWRFRQQTSQDQLDLLAKLDQQALQTMRQNVVDQTMTVLRNRVNELGIAEPLVQQQGKDRIVVDLPGVQDAAQASKILGGTATLEFRMVDASHDVRTALAGEVPIGTKIYHFKDGQPLLLKNRILLKGSNITSATTSYGQNGLPVVNISVSGNEVSYFNRATRANVGKRMAIVYVEVKNSSKLVNGKVVHVAKKVERIISAPVIQSALGANFQIEGIANPREAHNLALLLRAGALPANIYPIAESTVGPSLGKENIRKGIISVEIGFIAIVIFMMIYYRLFGFIANLALAANLVFIVAILSLFGATLTLPGIAGIVLTVGMAVDANVLINERIREELRLGMSPQAAIHAGYERAFSTIVDANVTTLIVAVVLFALASGPVKGFAITLTIGLLTSMVTAITGTRAVVNLIYGGRKVTKLSIGI